MTNNSGTSGLANPNVYVFLYGQLNPGGNAVFTIDPATGIATTNTSPASGNAPSVTLADLTTNGVPRPILIDSSLNVTGGRIYLSNSPAAVTVSGGVPNGPTAATASFYYDFVEFALNGQPNNLNIDTTQVDQVGFPLTIQVNPADPNYSAGSGFTVDRATLLSQFRTLAQAPGYAAFADCIFTAPSQPSTVYRLLNPTDVILSQVNAVSLLGTIGSLSGSPGAWQATYTITGPITPPATLPPTNSGVGLGMIASGQFMPAGATVSGTSGTQAVTVTSKSTSATNPFQAATNAAVNFYVPPTTGLATYFDQAIDAFFTFYKNNPNTLQVEQNLNGTNVIFTGNVTTTTATDINGGTSTYTVLQFVGGGKTYNVYYPFFTTNSPAGKTTPLGTPVVPPPSWWALPSNPSTPRLTQYEPPSQMVFGCDGAFADNTFQYAAGSIDSTALGGIENVLVTSLNRGTATALQFVTGTITATSPVSTSATVTLTSGTTAGLTAGMNVFSYQDASIPLTIASVQNATTFTITSPLPILPTSSDLLTASAFYPAGGTWNAFADFLHNGTASITVDGRAYAFAFDDQGGFSSDLNSTSTTNAPATVFITIDPWTPPPLLAVGAGASGGPYVHAFNADGSLRFQLLPYPVTFSGGVRVATGDLDGDGIDDIVTAAGPGGGPHVRAFSGVDGHVLLNFFAYDKSFTGGVFVAVGDVDGDGRDDIVTGADAGGGPHVKVFSGTRGAELMSFFAYDAAFSGGVRVAVGDLNGDGRNDLILGAGPGGGPHVRVVSGVDGASLASLFAYDKAFTGGVYVAAGDINGDGHADIITGAGFGGGPNVKAFSGRDGAPLRNYFAYATNFTGGVRVGSLDIDGDGFADIVTGAGPGGGPDVRVRSGATAGDLANLFAFDPAFLGGIYVGG
ncbi:MAG: beta-1,3-glucanase family protein [Gemmataceae bacterium]